MSDTSPLYQHLMLLQSRPAIFLGGHSIDRLNANLYGWKAHRHNHPDGDSWADHFFAEFHKFVASKYGETKKLDWHQVIAKQVTGPREQLSLFYTLLTEFIGSTE